MDDLHMLPRQPLGSFETFASTIESTKDVQIEAGSDNSADGTQRAIASKFQFRVKVKESAIVI